MTESPAAPPLDVPPDAPAPSIDVAEHGQAERPDSGRDHGPGFSAAMEAVVCDQVLGGKRHGL